MSELRTNKIFPKEGKPSGAIGGGIVQVVRAQNTTQNQTPSSNDTWTSVSPTITITPTSSSNLIIIETSVLNITRDHGYFGGLHIISHPPHLAERQERLDQLREEKEAKEEAMRKGQANILIHQERHQQ